MRKNMNKTTMFILTAVGLLLLYTCIAVWQTWFYGGTVVKDPNVFFDGTYKTYQGGDKVSTFFPEYENISDYERISFYYFDGTYKASPLHRFLVTYELDIKYDADVYESKRAEALAGYSYETTHYGDFEINVLTSYDNNMGKNTLCICVNDDNYTIRYLFFNNYSVKKPFEVTHVIPWNADSEMDW